MRIAFKVRIYPTTSQTILINKTIGCCRFIYNQMLAERIVFYRDNKSDKTLLYSHKYKTEAEYKQEYQWLGEVDAHALQQSRRNLESAYRGFFAKNARHPRFHRKKEYASYRTIENTIRIDWNNSKIRIPKVGWVKFRDGRSKVGGRIKSVTVSRTPTGKYYISANIEQDREPTPKKPITKVIGLDMSLPKFYVDQNSNSPNGFRRFYREQESKLARQQRIMSRRKIGSSNWNKARQQVALTYERIANQRRDFQEKLSKQLVSEYDLIALEDLNMKGMGGSLRLGKSVYDLGWGEFVWILKYKAEDAGCTLVFADRMFPSSKLCHSCGFKNTELKLSDRKWTCPNCGKHLDRDTNAALNLVNYGLGAVSPEVTPVETTVHDAESRKQECTKRKNCKQSPQVVFTKKV